MQKPIVIIGIILIAAVAAYVAFSQGSQNTAQTEPSSLNWHTDLNSALDEAKRTNKPVMVDFTATWCYYCKKLDETTLPNLGVQEKLSKNYVVAKIDVDKYSDAASQFKVYGYPTLVFLNPNGQEIKRQEGYIDADGLLNRL